MEPCVGGAFFPGIEAGGLPDHDRPIIEPFRLNHSVVSHGAITYEMALPWQNDFYQCADNWWPVPRPNYVTRQDIADQLFTAGLIGSGKDMVDDWHKLGFILRDGTQYKEFERCDTASIRLLTPLTCNRYLHRQMLSLQNLP